MTATRHCLHPAAPDPLTGSSPEPVMTEPVDELLAERARVAAELDRLGVVDQRLAEAEQRLAEIEAGLQALDRADAEQIRAWADAGEGEAPRPLVSERRALLARRLDATAEAEGARNAVAAVAAKRSALAADLSRIARQQWFAKLDAAMSEAERAHAEAVEITARLGPPMMRLAGLRMVLVDLIVTLPAGEMQHRTGEMIGRLDAFPKLNFAGDAAVANAFARTWLEQDRKSTV